MKYKIEELLPIVAGLAESYTAKESTSITYEKAQQLMEAVIYCIHECELAEQLSLVSEDGLSAQKMYALGVIRVEEKVRKTLKLYNEIMTCFSSYENACLYDTVAKGLPEFFKWYDCRLEPQNTILTLDYPVLFDLSQQTGIDRIYNYVRCIQLEQTFLNKFSPAFVTGVLSKYDKNYPLMIDNICEIVLMNVICHILSGKKSADLNFEPEEYKTLQTMFQKENPNALRERLKNAVQVLIRDYYENDENMMEYLCKAIDNISVRLKNAADIGRLHYLS